MNGATPLARFLVQASSRSWKGAPDPCLNPVEGRPAVVRTLERVAAAWPGLPITLVAPAFDRGGPFEELRAGPLRERLALLFAHDADPLARLVDATADLPDEALVARCDGLHCFVDLRTAAAMAERAHAERLDVVKLPDDFPPAFASEIYRVGALRRLAARLDPERDAALRAYPRHAACRPDSGLAWALHPAPRYADEELRAWRRAAATLYDAPRQEGDERRRLRPGDQSRFHYELAAPHLKPHFRVLEAACGDGAGTRFLAERVAELVAVDLEAGQLPRLRGLRARKAPVVALAADVCRLPFPDAFFDAITSFETIEHTDPEACLDSFARVLRPGGVLVLSTPQSSLGHIPLNPHHRRELSLAELEALVAPRFRVRERIGIKAGRIVVPGDPTGSNTVLVCERP
ncbi:MAG TPA: class I SAM-dependent methyltransferase [Myxococcota bacterium]